MAASRRAHWARSILLKPQIDDAMVVRALVLLVLLDRHGRHGLKASSTAVRPGRFAGGCLPSDLLFCFFTYILSHGPTFAPGTLFLGIACILVLGRL